MKKILYWSAILMAAGTGCKKSDDMPAANQPAGQRYEYSVTPSAANPAITTFNSNHYVVLDTRVTRKNKLFIFLPGTTGFPSVYTLIVQKAASMGYHAIGLMYPNNSDLYTTAATSTDLSLFGKGRQEIFDGSDQVSGISVDANNCIKTRLLNLLQYLEAQHPSDQWGQYISGSEINWSKVIIAGHSQGGGHALYISKKVAVDRAISFSSIDWNIVLGQSAAWVTEAGATPMSKLYSFNNINDQIFNYANVQTQLTAMNFTGPEANIDTQPSPYGGSHRLVTAQPAAVTLLVPDHNMTCLDQYIPKTGTGAVSPGIDSAWTYLIGM